MSNDEHPFSWQAIVRIITTIFILVLIWKTLNILVLVLISVMFATALYPLVVKLQKRLPLLLATLLVVLLLLVPFIILIATIVPGITHELPTLLTTINKIIRQSTFLPPALKNLDLTVYAQNAGSYVLQSTSIITGVVTSTLTLLFLTFYFLYDSKRLFALALSLFPKQKQKKLSRLFSELAQVNGQYIRGNLIISVICGVTCFIGLSFIGIPFAAPLAIFSSIMDLLPLVGSTIGMIPALIIGFAISPVAALLVLALYFIYQQIEGAFLAPTIYNKALNLSPALGFLAVIVGSALYGIIGAFLALPIAASLPAVIKYVREETEDNEEKKVTEKQLRKYKRKSV
jgi:predicted PurR-regulated permease PerM